MLTFKQGESKIISASIVENGSPVNLSSCPNIKAILTINNKEQKKYALVQETDYGTLEVDDTNTNKVNIIVERAHSALFEKGLVQLTLLLSFTDAAFEGGVRVEEKRFINIARVDVGLASQETI